MTAALEALEQARKRLTLLLLALGGLAALLAWGLTLGAGRPVILLDLVLLPLALLSLGAMGLMLLGRLSYQVAQVIPVLALAGYQLGALLEFALRGMMFQEGFSSTAMWFPLFYPLVFLLMPYRRALGFSLVYFGVALAVLALTLPGALGTVQPKVFNTVVQFYLTNVFYLMLLAMYARYRHSFYQMRLLAQTDALTGLPNRRGLEPQMALALERTGAWGVLLLDLDHFKRVNDQHGHAAGDQVLRESALRLNHSLQGGELLARWGGEEFVVFVPLEGERPPSALAEVLRQCIETQPMMGFLPLTVSVGVADALPGDTVSALLERADEALYQAKRAGRNRVRVWHPDALGTLEVEQMR